MTMRSFWQSRKNLIAGLVIVLVVLGLLFATRTVGQKKLAIEKAAEEAKKANEPVLIPVTFTTQAPDGNWKNPVFQHGCEEADAVMAMHWALDIPLTPENAAKDITGLTKLEEKKEGAFYWNISAEDLTNLMKEYYAYDDIELRKDVTVDDIKTELQNGNVIIIYTNGKLLHNPYYPHGSAYHTLVVKGFDPKTNEFITNDSGTNHGDGYRYSVSVIDTALRDYPTGPYQEVPVVHKNIIVVRHKKA